MSTPLNSPLFIFHSAVDFFQKATLAAAENFKAEENEIKQFDSMIHPKLCMPIVNLSFSLELILKGLLKQRQKKLLKTHNLVILFKALDSDIKEKIITHYKNHDTYKKLVGIRLIHGDGTGHSKQILLPAPSQDENGIIQMLETHKNYFEAFRYLFEVKESEEYLFLFREFCNFSFSALTILGSTLNLKVVSTSRKKMSVIE